MNEHVNPPTIHFEVCEPSPFLLNCLVKGGCGKEKGPDLRVGSNFSIDEMIKLIYYLLTTFFLDVRT